MSNSNLITLKYISVCQSCKENFNSGINAPFLLKCGHFFCKFCLENNYTDEQGRLYCPDDGIIANNLSELRLLTNLIIDKTKNVTERLEEDEVNKFFKNIFTKFKLKIFIVFFLFSK